LSDPPAGISNLLDTLFGEAVMKLNSFLSTALIATVAALSFGAQAADADKAPAEQTEKTTPKKVKPHSHMTEKTGIRRRRLRLRRKRRHRPRMQSVTTTSGT
jgi:hypothetical protein